MLRLPRRLRNAAQCLGFLMLVACGRGRSAAVNLEKPDTLVYEGGLSKEANERLFDLYRNAQVKPRLLKITSGGGDVNLGMDLGEWVFQNKLDVEVIDHCISSCANYVFTAGRTKFLNPRSVLAWHGGAYQPDMEEQINALIAQNPAFAQTGKAFLDTWKKREDAFFKTVGVNQFITTYGQRPDSGRPQGTLGWDFSIEDMAKFGITNVVEKGGPWRWRDLRPKQQSMVFRAQVTSPLVQ